MIVAFAIAGQLSDLGPDVPRAHPVHLADQRRRVRLVFLLAVTSVAVVVWTARDHHGHGGSGWRFVAPVLAALALLVVVHPPELSTS
ncbi:hypothetical protein QJS66_13325 [Kocuria rhizophila]|nr:hypothetical protein QJS66_13325 [Kocuria rhizophila]